MALYTKTQRLARRDTSYSGIHGDNDNSNPNSNPKPDCNPTLLTLLTLTDTAVSYSVRPLIDILALLVIQSAPSLEEGPDSWSVHLYLLLKLQITSSAAKKMTETRLEPGPRAHCIFADSRQYRCGARFSHGCDL